MICNETQQLLCEYLDDLLSGEVKKDFESHLAHCPECAEEVHQHKEMLAWVKQAECVEPPSGLRRSVLDRLEKEIHVKRFPFAPGFAQVVAAAAVFLIMVAGNLHMARIPANMAGDAPPSVNLEMAAGSPEEEAQMMLMTAPDQAADPEEELAEPSLRTFEAEAKEEAPTPLPAGESDVLYAEKSATPDRQAEDGGMMRRILFNAVLVPLLMALLWLAYKKRKEAW